MTSKWRLEVNISFYESKESVFVPVKFFRVKNDNVLSYLVYLPLIALHFFQTFAVFCIFTVYLLVYR